jgi:hypothetical protein
LTEENKNEEEEEEEEEEKEKKEEGEKLFTIISYGIIMTMVLSYI